MKNVYDNSEFFDSYQNMRSGQINANNLIENPAIKKLLPELDGKSILDLGCGDGNMDKYFVRCGAKRVLATDISTNMIVTAKKQNFDDKIEYANLPMEDIASISEKFDIVYSSLAFHYVKDIDKLFADIYNVLNPNGILVFSQESPLNTAIMLANDKMDNKIEIDGKRYYLLSDYCNEGERNVIWNDISVTKYHRTYATLVNALLKNNFCIVQMQDSYASEQAVKLCEKYKYQKDKPYFTFIKATKI